MTKLTQEIQEASTEILDYVQSIIATAKTGKRWDIQWRVIQLILEKHLWLYLSLPNHEEKIWRDEWVEDCDTCDVSVYEIP